MPIPSHASHTPDVTLNRSYDDFPALDEGRNTILRVVTDFTAVETKRSEDSDHDSEIDTPLSLFGPDGVADWDGNSSCMNISPSPVQEEVSFQTEKAEIPAQRNAPPIPGVFFEPTLLLPEELANSLIQTILDTYFQNEDVNQVMLFGRTASCEDSGSSGNVTGPGLPQFLTSLVSSLSGLLQPYLPEETYALLFPPPEAPPRARQAIINLYRVGEGISPHVDLLKRFGDGIIGISLGSSCVMSFENQSADLLGAPSDGKPAVAQDVTTRRRWDLFLPERSVLILSGDARYHWTHGIEGRSRDFVQAEDGRGGEWMTRGVRLSITFRWLLPGAEIVGEAD